MDSPLDLLGYVLAFWYTLFHSYGLSIIGLTVVVRLLLFPLTAKSVRSQRAMSELQPQIKQIQARYRDDRQKMNEELMGFYKENRINPLSGCLPLLLQMPVFFGLLRVLNDPYKFVPRGSELFRSMCPSGYDACAEQLAHIRFLGMDLQTSPTDASGSFMDTLPYWLLLGLVVLTGLYQGRQMLSRQTNPNPQVAIIARVMPILFGIFSVSFASGVIVYFLTSNLWQIGQQAIIYRNKFVPAGDDDDHDEGDGDAKPRRTSPSAAGAAGDGGGGMRSLFARRLPGGGASDDAAPTDAGAESPANGKGTPAKGGAPAKGDSAGKGVGLAKDAGNGAASGRSASSDREAARSGGTSGSRSEADRSGGASAPARSSGGQRPSGRASGTSNRSKNKRKRR
jgi:YidC/Oxa1 family membrane protein insertase